MKKQKYAVYRLDELNYGKEHVSHSKTFVGQVSAISPRQAIKTTKHLLNLKRSDMFCSYQGNGCRISEIVVERV